MKSIRSISQPQGLALLQALPIDPRLPPRVAVLEAALTSADDGWHQLLPAGAFTARDGRPFDVDGGQWHLDEQTAGVLIAKARNLGQDILIDYDHQTLKTDHNGQPAPAAGWFNADEILWREGEGLFIKPRWTEKAAAHLSAGEYRFLSAVFPYDANGRPLELRMAALVNDPGVVGMQALAALAAQFNSTTHSSKEEPQMNELLKKLLAKLGIEVPADGQLTGEQETAALSALEAALDKSKKVPELEQSVAALKAATPAQGQVDLDKYVPKETYTALVQQVAALSAKVDTTDAESVLKEAREQGKVVAAEEGYLREYAAQKGVAALKAMLAPRPALAALSAQQTTTQTPPPPPHGLAVLSADEKEAARLMGIPESEFMKRKKETV